MPKHPPMYKQYKKLKAVHPNALLLYRLGDFYELFEEDAETAARELGLRLTKRRFSKELRLPMAGFPYRYVNSYLGRLVAKGYMVAVADQLEDSRKAKGLVKRGVVRVVTSGTVMEQPLLKETGDNFLLALTLDGKQVGLAFVDISTGDFNCAQLARADLPEELTLICPSEIILPQTLTEDTAFCQSLTELGVSRLSPLEPDVFKPETAQNILQEHFQVASLEAFSSAPLGLSAAGAVLHYLKSNHLAKLGHITTLTTYRLPDYLALDAITRRNLELTRTLREGSAKGTLFSTLNKTKTRMGARLLRRWINHPLYNLPAIQARLDAVETLFNNAFLRQDLRDALHGIYDLERLAGRIGYGNANGRDLVNLKHTLIRVPGIKKLLERCESPPSSGQAKTLPSTEGIGGERDSRPTTTLLATLHRQLNPLAEVARLIEKAVVDEPPILLKDGGLIKAGFNADLELLRQTAEDDRVWLTQYEAAERERTGIKNLRIKYTQVFGFFIEVTRSNLKRVPDNYERRATISTGERFITPELKTRENRIIAAEDAAKDLEYDLFWQVRQSITKHLPPLRQTAQALAQVDVLASLAESAALQNYVKPSLTTAPTIQLREARHPVVEQLLPGDSPFVPNNCALNESQRLLVLTGPNMSGKSVYLRQISLAALMAQMGSFVAATEAEIGLADRIFVRAGASDDISQGRSTFLVEMSETAHILHHATERSLVILDEVGRGTSTYDGLSLAWAVAEEIHTIHRARCLFATHFHELTALGNLLPGGANFNMAVREQDGKVIFLRQIIPGGADRSYGIHVARLAGLPECVLQKAQQILISLENTPADPSTSLKTDYRPVRHLRQGRLPAPVAEQPTTYNVEAKPAGNELTLPADDRLTGEIIAEMYRLDIANLTPVEALVRLNRWQQQLKKG